MSDRHKNTCNSPTRVTGAIAVRTAAIAARAASVATRAAAIAVRTCGVATRTAAIATRAAGVVAVTAALAACSDGEAPREREGDRQAVMFGSALATRATGVNALADIGSFAVSGYYCVDAVINTDAASTDDLGSIATATMTTQPIMDNVAVSRQSDGSYTYQDKVYWPQNPATGIQFFGWYPSTVAMAAATGAAADGTAIFGGVTTAYTVPPAVADQQDLLYAVTAPLNKYVEWDKQGRTTDAPLPVDMNFKHALSRITFKVAKDTEKETDTNVKFYIRKITLYAIDKGTLTLAGSGYGSSFTPSATWSVVRTYPTDASGNSFSYRGFELDFTKTDATEAAAATDYDNKSMNYQLCGYDGNYYPVADQATSVTLNDGSEYLFMIPQQKPQIGESVTPRPTQVNLPMVHIDYIYDNGIAGDGHVLVDGYATISIGDQFGDNYTGTEADTYLWTAGQSLVYTIKLSTSGSVILFSPTEWEDGTTTTDGTYNGDVIFQ